MKGSKLLVQSLHQRMTQHKQRLNEVKGSNYGQGSPPPRRRSYKAHLLKKQQELERENQVLYSRMSKIYDPTQRSLSNQRPVCRKDSLIAPARKKELQQINDQNKVLGERLQNQKSVISMNKIAQQASVQQQRLRNISKYPRCAFKRAASAPRGARAGLIYKQEHTLNGLSWMVSIEEDGQYFYVCASRAETKLEGKFPLEETRERMEGRYNFSQLASLLVVEENGLALS